MQRDFGSYSIKTNRKQEEGIREEVGEKKKRLLAIKIMISTMTKKGYKKGQNINLNQFFRR